MEIDLDGLTLDTLFLSKRIFVDDHFIEGGILVTSEGKIRKLLRSQEEVNSIMYACESEAVSFVFIVIFVYIKYII